MGLKQSVGWYPGMVPLSDSAIRRHFPKTEYRCPKANSRRTLGFELQPFSNIDPKLQAVTQSLFDTGDEAGNSEEEPAAIFGAPKAKSKEKVIDKAEFDLLLTYVGDETFRDFLIVSWETGSRPQESLRVEARHFEPENRR